MFKKHLSRQHLSSQLLSISRTTHLLLTQFWPNFKGRFLGPSLTDAKCHSYISPGNICLNNFCPYQEQLTYYYKIFLGPLIFFWPNFFWAKFFGPTFCLINYLFKLIFLDLNFFGSNFLWSKFVWFKKYWLPKLF